MDLPPIPILDLKAQYAAIREEVNAAIARVLESQQFILGAEVENLEILLADYCQCQHAFGVSSGTDALLVSLMSIGIQPGDEVITTPYSFFATAGSITRLGAKPVFVDIDLGTFNIMADQVESAITPQTKAILPVHLAGQCADMTPIMEAARKHGLYVIEDACQAIGADYHGKRAGSIGDLGCFSFFPSKNLGGYGDSGMVTTNNTSLAEKISLLRNHGMKPKYHNQLIGGNFRMDAIQAAVLSVKFNHLEDWSSARRMHAATYRELFAKAGITSQGAEIADQWGIIQPEESGSGRHIYHLFMIRSKHRDELREYLKSNHIGSEIYYPIPLHLQECFSNLGYKRGDFPNSEKAAMESLALPIYPEMTEEMISRVVDTTAEFTRQHR